VTCAIRLYDDFTGKLLKGPEYKFKVNGLGYNPICKADGYFVLTNIIQPLITVEIDSEHYKTSCVTIDTALLNKSYPVYDIRLLRAVRSAHHISKRLIGNIKIPETWIIAVPELTKPLLKFGGIEKSYNDCWMVINSLIYQDLLGHVFTIKDSKPGPLELFVALDKKGHNQFKVSCLPQKEYSMNEEIVRVYRTITEKDGSFDMLIDDFYDCKIFTMVYKKKEKWVHENISLQGG
jgi:hypothetical protein